MGMGVSHHRLSLTFSGVCVPEQKSPGQVFVSETQEMFLMRRVKKTDWKPAAYCWIFKAKYSQKKFDTSVSFLGLGKL